MPEVQLKDFKRRTQWRLFDGFQLIEFIQKLQMNSEVRPAFKII